MEYFMRDCKAVVVTPPGLYRHLHERGIPANELRVVGGHWEACHDGVWTRVTDLLNQSNRPQYVAAREVA